LSTICNISCQHFNFDVEQNTIEDSDYAALCHHCQHCKSHSKFRKVWYLISL